MGEELGVEAESDQETEEIMKRTGGIHPSYFAGSVPEITPFGGGHWVPCPNCGQAIPSTIDERQCDYCNSD